MIDFIQIHFSKQPQNQRSGKRIPRTHRIDHGYRTRWTIGPPSLLPEQTAISPTRQGDTLQAKYLRQALDLTFDLV